MQIAKATPVQQPQPELLAAAVMSSSAVTVQLWFRSWFATAFVEKHQACGRHTTTQSVVNFDNLAIDLDAAAPEAEGQNLNLALEDAMEPASPGALSFQRGWNHLLRRLRFNDSRSPNQRQDLLLR